MSDAAYGDLPEAISPPMANGEVVFEAPWQGRLFGMAVALAEKGVFDWADMQASLIAVIETDTVPDAPYEYYTHFAHALSRVLEQAEILSEKALADLMAEFAERPPGHDHHHHDHHHEHDHH